jgi:hypothetical protein
MSCNQSPPGAPVEDHVVAAVRCLAGECFLQCEVRTFEADGGVSAEVSQCLQRFRVTSSADDASGPQVLGELDGQPPGDPGGAMDQHRLAGLQSRSPRQCEPRRHCRVWQGSCRQIVHRSGIGRQKVFGTMVFSAIVP